MKQFVILVLTVISLFTQAEPIRFKVATEIVEGGVTQQDKMGYFVGYCTDKKSSGEKAKGQSCHIKFITFKCGGVNFIRSIDDLSSYGDLPNIKNVSIFGEKGSRQLKFKVDDYRFGADCNYKEKGRSFNCNGFTRDDSKKYELKGKDQEVDLKKWCDKNLTIGYN